MVLSRRNRSGRTKLLGSFSAGVVLCALVITSFKFNVGMMNNGAPVMTARGNAGEGAAGSVDVGGGAAARHIFLDLGAKDGDSIDAFVTQLAKQIDPSVPLGQWEIYGFEPSPQNLPNLEAYVKSSPYDIKVVDAAVWTEDGTLEFNLDARPDKLTGGSVYSSPFAKGGGATVKSVDFSKWLQANIRAGDKVFAKMDIEGAEGAVLEKMEKDGTVQLIDRIAVEWHSSWNKEDKEKNSAAYYSALFKKMGVKEITWNAAWLQPGEKGSNTNNIVIGEAGKEKGSNTNNIVIGEAGKAAASSGEVSLKIYVYNLPLLLRVGIFNAKPLYDHYWATEYWIPESITKHPTIFTANPEEADLFLVPVYAKAMHYSQKYDEEATTSHFNNVLDFLNILPYFSRFHGKDHVFIFAGGDGAQRWTKWREHISQSIILTPESGYLVGQNVITYAPGKDVLIPGYTPDPMKLHNQYFEKERSTLFFFAGNPQSVSARVQMLDLWNNTNSKEIFVTEAPLNKTTYLARASEAKFCPIVRGISLWTSRFFELSILGCVPVLIGSAWELPFANHIPYDTFTLRFPERVLPQLQLLLSSVPDSTYQKLRQALKQNVHSLMYDMDNPTGSAYDLVLRELASRAANLRGMKAQSTVRSHVDMSTVGDVKHETWELNFPVKRVTHSPGYSYFGYFDKSPWSPDQTKILGGRVSKYAEDNTKDQYMEVGYTTVATGQWRTVARTSAFHYQQGCMLQWVGDSNELIVFNARTSRTSDEFCAHIVNINTGEIRTLPRPVYALSADGRWASSLNFGRLHTYRLGYGYVVSKEAQAQYKMDRAPANDGLYVMDMETGESRLILSFVQLFEKVQPGGTLGGAKDPFTGKPYASSEIERDGEKVEVNVNYTEANTKCRMWFNHANMDRSGDLITFLFRMSCDDGRRQLHGNHNTQQFTIERNGNNLWRIPYVFGSHHDFGDNGQLLICDNFRGGSVTASHLKQPNGTFVRTVHTQSPADFGHCSYEPTSSEWILSDTYAGRHKACNGTLCKHMFLRKCCNPHLHGSKCNKFPDCSSMETVGFFGIGPEGGGASRSDLHPRWSRDGTKVAIDSTHEASLGVGRQMYVVELGKLP